MDQVLVFIVLNMPRLVLGLNEVIRVDNSHDNSCPRPNKREKEKNRQRANTIELWNILFEQVLHLPAVEKCFKQDYHYHQGKWFHIST